MAKISEAQVKDLKAKFTEEQLADIAERFGKIPNSYTKSADIIAAGFLTEEEFAALPICPRTGEVTSVSSWPRIGGRKTYPLSGALNYEETEKYYAFKKEQRGGASATGGGSKKLDPAVQEDIDYIRRYLIENNVPAEVRERFERVIPRKKDSMLEAMFGVSDASLLKGKVNIAYVMFRGPNGEFAEELQPNGADLFTKGFMPKFTLDQIKANLKKMQEKGVDMSGCIVDLQ